MMDVKPKVERQLDFLRHLYNSGARTIDQAYDKLSNRMIESNVIRDFVRDCYQERESVIFDYIREG